MNKLFNYTDALNWEGLINEVFTDSAWIDMSSLGAGEPQHMELATIAKHGNKLFWK